MSPNEYCTSRDFRAQIDALVARLYDLTISDDSLAEEEQRIRSEGAKAMQTGDHDTATAVIEFAKRLLAFQQPVGDAAAGHAPLADRREIWLAR
jgi:hypothetical protein